MTDYFIKAYFDHCKMLKHTQTICWQFADELFVNKLPTNCLTAFASCLSVFDYFVGFAFKGLKSSNILQTKTSRNSTTALHGETTKYEFFFDKTEAIKNAKIKRAHAFKYCARFCNMEVLNSSDPELQVKNAEPETKNKSKKLLNELRGFGLKIKKKTKLKQNIAPFIQTQKQKQVFTTQT